MRQQGTKAMAAKLRRQRPRPGWDDWSWCFYRLGLFLGRFVDFGGSKQIELLEIWLAGLDCSETDFNNWLVLGRKDLFFKICWTLDTMGFNYMSKKVRWMERMIIQTRLWGDMGREIQYQS